MPLRRSIGDLEGDGLRSRQVDGGQPATDLLEKLQRITEPADFSMLGRVWKLLPGVYAPHLTRCAALYAEWLPYPVAGEFCEIGSGTGYLSVLAAARGVRRVVATDINPEAVANTQANAVRHGVHDKIEALVGSMFSPLGSEDQFDLIFWNSNYVDAEPASSCPTGIAHAVFDPGYTAHDLFMSGARRHLRPNGRLLLGYSSLGNRLRLSQLAQSNEWTLETLRSAVSLHDRLTLSYELIQLVDKSRNHEGGKELMWPEACSH